MDNGGAFTDRLMAGAAIAAGARALDIGCGGGDVAFRLAAAVGDTGRVTGLDVDAAAIDRARRAAAERGVTNAAFESRDFLDLAPSGAAFDVITCRRVLMYLPDQARAAAAMFNLLRPNGILLVQEHDATVRHPAPDRPLADLAQRWIWETVQREGANINTGFQLHALLSNAGFTNISLVAEAVVETQDQAAQTAGIVRVMLPRIVAAGVATAEEIDIDTLDERLTAERLASDGVSLVEMIFGAIARVP
ncbi:MAG: methyltransferase domain-containing protein [Pseudomonadota bacterium]